MDGHVRDSCGPQGGLTEFTRCYVGFASRRPVLIDLIFASKDRPGVDAATTRAFEPGIRLIAAGQRTGEVRADRDAVYLAVLAMIRGLAAVVISGMAGSAETDATIGSVIGSLLYGITPRR